ncbi:hypothetical protein [Aquimarina agarivorans]|uniref:hypothetical protein n=1 Tax=Aquimarina agarivorans TaxID=980584 RepID=UPI001300C9CB|nr:hypothetical protein [Aquimarina agarivorans]
MHIISEQLGGPAVNTNLTPAPSWTNRKFYEKVEAPAIRALNHGDLIWYDVSVSYGHRVANKKFIDSLSAKYGAYEYDGTSSSWKKKTTNLAIYNAKIPAPRISQTIININREIDKNEIHRALKVSKSLAEKIINYRNQQKAINPSFKYKALNFEATINTLFAPRNILRTNINEAITQGRVHF